MTNKIRTSPDHGTAYDIAGKGIAGTTSFEEALFKAHYAIFNREAHEVLYEHVEYVFD